MGVGGEHVLVRRRHLSGPAVRRMGATGEPALARQPSGVKPTRPDATRERNTRTVGDHSNRR